MAEVGDITVTFGVAAIVSAVVSYLTARISGYSKDVIEERSKWREKIRDCARSFVITQDEEAQKLKNGSMNLSEIEAELITRLNPFDKEDIEIVKCLRQRPNENDDKVRKEFLIRIALLLKHDWERAKWETRVFKNPLGPPQRMKFQHYKAQPERLGNLL